jgi:hypothetical protein
MALLPAPVLIGAGSAVFGSGHHVRERRSPAHPGGKVFSLQVLESHCGRRFQSQVSGSGRAV